MMMKSALSGPFLLLLLLLLLLSSTVSGLGSVVSKYYNYIQTHLTWQQAQSYCRDSTYYIDLAIIYRQSDEDLMYMKTYSAWTGLHKEPSNRWIWSNEEIFSWNHWAQNEPNNGGRCAIVYSSNQRFYDRNCGDFLFFFCHKKYGPSSLRYTFIPQSKSWLEAQQYCREVFHDLATFRTDSDLNLGVVEQDFPVWTGLHRDGGTWRWSTGLSEYRNWASSEPGNNGDCVSISSSDKEMATQNCTARFPFVCFRDNLVLVKENKTWREALEHCRALSSPYSSNLRYELLSVQPGEDHEYVLNRVMEADTEEVWAGLRFLAGHWLWVNGASMLYSDLPLCPLFTQHCGVLSKNNTGSVEITDCSEKRNFLCYSTY
ncbi:macrophage mannose receptor 1-like [Cottoperca gobio]|uniref:Macrophage mannose receptor 1-like n=1 Tax=Cottoperca gobio TaxID=56716 RepID=A0A6J2PAL0_COTGO|nr:macrophage mannose receptor 1-like [Cottoperca gobio]